VTLASTPVMRIQLCGPTVIEHNGRRLDGLIPARQGRQLFAYLVLHRHRLTSHAELAGVLWPDEPPAASANAVNALLSKLRRALGPDVLAGRATLQLHLPPAWVDIEAAADAVHRAESAVALGDWVRAWGPAQVALFLAERDFLPGNEAPWIEEQRRRLAVVHLAALEAYATSGLGIGGTELAAAVRAGRELTRLAPLRESGHRLLMRALARQGNVAEALGAYSRLCAVLRDELGVSPSTESRALRNTLTDA
jgi:DNA-binding SARP family transcriptional activator